MKGEYQKCAPQGKITPSIEPRNGGYIDGIILKWDEGGFYGTWHIFIYGKVCIRKKSHLGIGI